MMPAPEGTSVTRCFKLSPAKICNLLLKFHNPMKICGTRFWIVAPDEKKKYNMTHREPQLIIGLHKFIIWFYNFSSGYAILVPGYKFRGWQFEIPGYTCTVGGRRGLSYSGLVRIDFFVTSAANRTFVGGKNMLRKKYKMYKSRYFLFSIKPYL